MSVQRYWFSAAGGHLNESAGGDLVAYSDYAALKEENERLKLINTDSFVSIASLENNIKTLKARVAELEGGIDREVLIDRLADALGDAMDCTRVWEAWSVGTMSQDDFSLIVEDSERLGEIADAAISAMTHRAKEPKS